MISTVTSDRCYEFRGLRSDFEKVKNDQKFALTIGNGSIFFIIDESVVYMFDEANKAWIEVK